jgi:uncharacterized iron-regulated membrane protein
LLKCNLHKTYWGRVALVVAGLLAVATLAWGALIVLAFQKGAEKAKPAPTITETTAAAPTHAPRLSAQDDKFVRRMQERPTFQDDTPEKLIETAKAVCVALDTGATIDTVLMVARDSGIDPYDAGWLVAGSVLTYCPEFTDKLQEAVE